MGTLSLFLQYRKRTIAAVRKHFKDTMKVRQGFSYIACQCYGCNRIFQVPYKGPAHAFALGQLARHLEECLPH